MTHLRASIIIGVQLILLANGSSSKKEKGLSTQKYVKHTCDNYEKRTDDFADWAEDADNARTASKCREVLLSYLAESIGKTKSFEGNNSRNTVKILDAGCGPGRDLAAFGTEYLALENETSLPIEAFGFDCAKGFVKICKKRGLNAVRADFIGYWSLVPKQTKYDGVFSLAALFHLPEKELVKALKLFHQHMYKHGVILSTIPMGDVDEERDDGRWTLHLSRKKQKKIFKEAGFKIVHAGTIHIYGGNNWLALVAVKA